MPRATENVEGMKHVIERLIHRNYAYVMGEPGRRVVYFNVQAFPAYGSLSGNTLDKLREGAGGRVSAENQSGKRHPADFLLWKEDPSHIMKWPSPWGEGYPGWHIECTAMGVRWLFYSTGAEVAEDILGGRAAAAINEPLIDLHSGGEDNIFPHHECEIAQSCCAFNIEPDKATYASMWFHPRFLLVEGEKMSKSKGNFFTARDLFAKGHEPAAVRLELIKTHYRSNANFTEQGLKDSARMVERWRRVLDEGKKGAFNDSGNEAAARCRAEFAASMMNDLNIAAAIAAVNTWVGAVHKPTPDDARLMKEIDDVLGVLGLERAAASESDIGLFIGVDPSPEVESKLRERRDARARKDFAASDRLRDELGAMGYAIKDAKDGKVEVRSK
jgi:cysteinyl-tRNA synthetase